MNRPKRKPQIVYLIDGYNLMFESIKLPDRRDGSQALLKARDYFLQYLAERLNLDARSRTCIVFDSQSDLLLPSELTVQDMQIRFAVGYNSADEMLHLLIDQHSAPKQLIVVSSDHQVQKKAKARGAKAIDSEDWVENYLSLFPLRDATPSVSSTSGKSSRSHARNANSRPNTLERIKKEEIELGLPKDFDEQLKQLLESSSMNAKDDSDGQEETI